MEEQPALAYKSGHRREPADAAVPGRAMDLAQCQAALAESLEQSRTLRERLAAAEQSRQQAEAERDQLARALAAAQEPLREAGRLQAQLVSALVHELRNPLNPILTSAQLLRRRGRERPDLLESATASIERQVRRMSQLIWDVSDFSRIGQGGVEPRLEPVDLAALAARAAEGWSPQAAGRQQALSVDLPGEPLPAQADAARLERMVELLLAYASMRTPAGGSIRMALAGEGSDAVLVGVRHSGAGIAAPLLERAFEPFAELGPPLHGSLHEGLGIGLALAKHYAEIHGGTVAALGGDEAQDAGFLVRLPLRSPLAE
jgi:signal transduction histidine kinase